MKEPAIIRFSNRGLDPDWCRKVSEKQYPMSRGSWYASPNTKKVIP